MNFESLILDIDGTLWDSRSVVAKGYNLQLKDEGLERFSVDEEFLKSVFGKVMTEIADIIFGELPEEERYPIMDRCMEREKETLLNDPCEGAGYPKVKETLEQLRKKHRLFIVSNSQCGYPEVCMKKLGLTDLICGHLCFGDTGTCKGETIKTLMAKHNITDACYIGDTQGDYEAATMAGTPFIWCAYGFGTPDDYVIKVDAFEELKEVL